MQHSLDILTDEQIPVVQPVKILIIRLSSIGDIVLTTPVIRCVQQQVPNAEIHFLAKKSFATLLESNPHISKLWLFDDNLEAIIETLKQQNFNCIIDLHHNLRTLRIKKGLKPVPHFSFDKLNIQKWLYTTFKINRMPAIHIVDRYLATSKTLGVTNDGKGLDYFLPKDLPVTPNDLPAQHRFGFIALVIGASYATKKLTDQKLIELCALIRYPIILVGGKEDQTAGEKIAAQDPIRIYNSCGKFSLNESAWIIQQSKLVITHDTGMMHIAAAFKKKIISIWGNTVPEFGMTPYFGNYQGVQLTFEVPKLSCRPCSKIGSNKCPKGHFKCMENQDLPKIAEAALRLTKS